MFEKDQVKTGKRAAHELIALIFCLCQKKRKALYVSVVQGNYEVIISFCGCCYTSQNN